MSFAVEKIIGDSPESSSWEGLLFGDIDVRKMELYPNFTIAFISKHMKAKASNWALPEGGPSTTMPLAVDDDARGWAAAVDDDDARDCGRPRLAAAIDKAAAVDDNARGRGLSCKLRQRPWPRQQL